MHNLFKQDLTELLQLRAMLHDTREQPTAQLQLIDRLVVLVLNIDEDSLLEVINAKD